VAENVFTALRDELPKAQPLAFSGDVMKFNK
jgi:hypothetical protein